jgi:hypothetical protein
MKDCSSCHPRSKGRVVLLEDAKTQGVQVMSRLYKSLISFSIIATAMTGCVVAPAGYYHRGYYGPRVAVVAPVPVVVVRPYR